MTTVLKFGSSVLPTERDAPGAVHEIYRWLRRGERVVAIVSAIGRTTDRLLAEARERGLAGFDLAEHVARGERESVGVLARALERAGIDGATFDSSEVGPWTVGECLGAEPVGFDRARVEAALDRTGVVVLPGFLGRDESGRTTLLGRGGSDLTAVFVAHRLGAARCRLLKDVDGIYTSDPNSARSPSVPPERYRACTFEDALRVGGRIVQGRAVEFARSKSLTFEVARPGGERSTLVGSARSLSESPPGAAAPMRVGLLGHGVVGGGVRERLLARPDLFDVVRVVVRDPARHAEVARDVLATDASAIIGCDLVIEATHGEWSAGVLEDAIRAGADVACANKALAVAAGERLRSIARAHARRFACSACVGGAMSALEFASRHAGSIVRFRGILNTTSNVVARARARGEPFLGALERARELGLLEADPRDDLGGFDAARKLVLLAREGFGADLDAGAVEVEALGAGTAPGLVPIATIERDALGGVRARVALEPIDERSPLWHADPRVNVLEATLAGGRVRALSGVGGGRWATTESVMADAMDAARARLEGVGDAAAAREGVAS